MNEVTIALKLLDAALAIGEFAAEDKARLEAGASTLRAMLRENRKPSPEEWAEINAISDAALARLAERAGG